MTNRLTPSRRDLLQALGVSSLSAIPVLSVPKMLRAKTAAARRLVLIELAGGNDGLNTVVPLRDPAYRHLRPEIGLPQRSLLTLGPETGLHPALRSVADLWERGAMRIVEGVGYPNPSRSHFRSIEIWNTGLGADARTHQGWISRSFEAGAPAPDADADGLVLGGEMGPLKGSGRFAALRDLEHFVEAEPEVAAAGHPVRPQGDINPLDHVLATYESARVTSARIRSKLERSQDRDWGFPDTEIGEQLRNAARLLDAGVEVPVIKVVQDGYDTHEAQPETHADLMADLSDAVRAFADALTDMGLWNDVTVMTYSEFGRRAYENGSGGTDHGTAAPVLVWGGGVAGGFAGARPSLDKLVDDDLVFTTDYRDLYRGILMDLWRLHASPSETASAIQILR